MKRVIVFFLFCCIWGLKRTEAQSLPVGTSTLEDILRRYQLMGDIDSSVSFTVRPAFSAQSFQSKNISGSDSVSDINAWLNPKTILATRNGKGRVNLLPVSWQQQYNSHHPYGWNDGAMIPAKGYQTLFSAGFHVQYGPLSIQLNPEFVFAQNSPFEGFSLKNNNKIWEGYYGYIQNLTDLPERFGKSPYSKASWGQSSIRLTFDPISIGISNENLWWGPGIRNSLLMSNTASGFKHLTLNTTKPIKTPIGSIEGQLIAGRLENSGFLPLENHTEFYSPKTDKWRYLSSFVFSYQPKWVPGLFLGMTRSFQMYHTDIDGLGDYIPLFQPFQKNKTNEDKKLRDQLASIFMRWMWQKARAEIYFEYGRNDHSADIRDFSLEPEHSRAYILGFRKIIPLLKRKEEFIQTTLEITQLGQTANQITREAGAWYLHWQVQQGYTNRGEVLGAGVGPGGNLQSLDVSWFRGINKIGLQLERYVHNSDYYYYAFSGTWDPRAEWVDFSAAATGQWAYKNLLLNTKLSLVRSLNYQWGVVGESSSTLTEWRDVFGFHGQLGLMYRF